MDINQAEINYFRRNLIKWGTENYTSFAWRSVDNLWHALVAEIMLQRTRSDVVEPEYIKFVKKYSTPQKYLDNKQPETFKNLGLPGREQIIKEIAEVLKEKKLLKEKRDLLSIKGVGNYTAAAVRSMYFNVRDTIVDGNVVRVYSRFFGFKRSPKLYTDKSFFEFADRVTPKRNFRMFNYSLLDFGREICSPIPKCGICPLKRKCGYYRNIVNVN
jgi:A/G-specific adenine glycosylase